MSAFAVLRRWPIATCFFVLHAVFVSAIYIRWATNNDVERGMSWMSVFLVDLPSSYLFVDRPGLMGLYAGSAILIGGLQWALVGAVIDLIRRIYKRKRSKTTSS
jgi:hypothetical protein